jgi:phosphoribosylformylglycinamidine cyclo-ligase
MCVNDLVVCGAEPLFFLDYYASGKLNIDVAATVVAGIGRGCALANCALVGGETAEMPGIYAGEDYDLAGFCVGVVENAKLIDGSKVTDGDVLIGLASSGPHSNGFSLIRQILSIAATDLHTATIDDRLLSDILLEPTRIYVQSLRQLIEVVDVHAMAHITGGGLLENIPRVLPEHTRAVVDTGLWRMPEVFNWLQHTGNIAREEMYRTFNCGIGMVICVAAADSATALTKLKDLGENAWVIGIIESSQEQKAGIDLISP